MYLSQYGGTNDKTAGFVQPRLKFLNKSSISSVVGLTGVNTNSFFLIVMSDCTSLHSISSFSFL